MVRAKTGILVLLVGVAGLGCGIVKGMSQREARNTHADSLGSCPRKNVTTEVVRELDPPEGTKYQAIIRATGCGQTALYLCTAVAPDGNYSYSCRLEGK